MLYISIHLDTYPYPSYIQKTTSTHLGGGIQICGLGELRLLQNGRWSALPRPENYSCTEAIRMNFDVFWCILESHTKSSTIEIVWISRLNKTRKLMLSPVKLRQQLHNLHEVGLQRCTWQSKNRCSMQVHALKVTCELLRHATMPPTKKPSMLGFLISSAPWKVDFSGFNGLKMASQTTNSQICQPFSTLLTPWFTEVATVIQCHTATILDPHLHGFDFEDIYIDTFSVLQRFMDHLTDSLIIIHHSMSFRTELGWLFLRIFHNLSRSPGWNNGSNSSICSL